MVSWTNLFAADPPGGSFEAIGRYPAVSTVATPWAGPSNWYYLSSPGAVDANIGTRAQYLLDPSINPTAGLVMDFWGAFIFDAADEAAAAGRTMTGTAYIAPASAFGTGVTPTIAEIRAASTARSRLNSGRLTAGTLKTYGDILSTTDPMLPPNTKYWFALVPSFVTDMGTPPTASSDVPMAPIETIGRAISFWSNRTPEKPVILYPPTRSSVLAGSSITLRFEPRGADRITSFPGDGGPNDLDDMSGVQIQYAPQPTPENPDPEWTDFTINDGLEPPFADGPGWYIDGTIRVLPPPGGDLLSVGAYQMWRFKRLPIQFGGIEGLTIGGAYLPSGDWQIRLRTFDYGHGWPNSTKMNPWTNGGIGSIPATADWTGQFDPTNFPESNTSPWSDPVYVSASEAVPPPLPLSPTNNTAVVADGDLVDLVWQYRNASAFPTDQFSRSVRIRAVGESEWMDLLVDDESSSQTYTVPFALVSGNQYEWQVRVKDEWEIESAWSESAFFWMVPEGGSGSVIPSPSEIIEGATLGTGSHSVHIYRRGGLRPVARLNNVVRVEWGRVRDEISDARIVTRDWDLDQGKMLALLQPWAYEVVIFRDNGYSKDRVWEGPITLLTYKSDEVVIQAKDIFAYAYRRIIKQAFVDSGNSPTAGDSVTSRASRILRAVFAPDDPNVLAYLESVFSDIDAKQYRSTPAYSRTAYEEIDDMAANAGLDYTAVGRRMILWGTKNRIGTLPEFRDADLGASPILSVYGMSMANVYAVSDGNGVWGEATRLDENGRDETYGLVEMLSSTWASDSESESGSFTEDGLNTVRESFSQSAERSIADRYPPPTVVRVPDNTRVNPDTVVSIQHLVPGVVVPLHSVSTLRQVKSLQKLDSVKVVEEAGTETVTVTLSPFSQDDNEVGESVE